VSLAIICIISIATGQMRPGVAHSFMVNDVADSATTGSDAIQPNQPIPSTPTNDFANPAVRERSRIELIDAVAPTVVTVEAGRRPTGMDGFGGAPRGVFMSVGSGVCIRSDGSILTSQHTIDRATSIYVVLSDGSRHAARLIAADRRSDLAVLRVDDVAIRACVMGDADDLCRGSFLMMLGNPMGLAEDGHAVASHGMVSALRRPLPASLGEDEDRYFGEMLVTDLAATSGSSGGPLFNARGELVGIMTAVFASSGAAPAFSFATPLNARNRDIVSLLQAGQVVEYGYLGVEVEEISDQLREALGLRRRIGIRIASVFTGGPAAIAGVQTGDIVIGVDGHVVASVDQFIRLVGAGAVGQQVKLTLRRGETSRHVTATLVRRPEVSDPGLPTEEISLRGATLGALSPSVRSAANLPEPSLLVLRVDADSSASRAGLAPGDVVVRVNGRPIDASRAEVLVGMTGDLMLGLADGSTILLKPAAR